MCGSAAEQAARGLDAVQLRHGHVHHHDVGLQLLGQFDGFAAVARFAHDLHVGLRAQDHLEALAHHGVVVSQQDADLFHSSAGTRTSITTPWPGFDCTVTSPPALRARARIPIIPSAGARRRQLRRGRARRRRCERLIAPGRLSSVDPDVLAPRVPRHVGERFLRDAEQVRLGLVRQPARVGGLAPSTSMPVRAWKPSASQRSPASRPKSSRMVGRSSCDIWRTLPIASSTRCRQSSSRAGVGAAALAAP